LSLGWSTIYQTVQKNYSYLAQASATTAAYLLNGVEIEKFQSDASYAQPYERMLEEISQAENLEYLYVYVPDTEKDTITFVIVIYGENSSSQATQERVSGTVISHSLSDLENAVWNTQESESIEETNNQYGDVLTSYSVVYDKSGNAMALVGADVSMEKALQTALSRYQMMVMAVTVSFVFVLGVLAIVLKKYVLKPAEIISHHMKNFVSDRQSGFEKIEVKGSDELAQMAQSFNSMAEEIDQYIKDITVLTEEKQRQETEIAIARNIQQGFLPEGHFKGSNIGLEAIMVPAKSVGGDFYDYFQLTDDTIFMVIADVSGKGITAALFMARAITVVRQYAKLGYSPAEILSYTNNALCSNNPEKMFLTIFVAIYNCKTHLFTYANGGHNPTFLLSDTIKTLHDAQGMIVGIFENENYQESQIVLKDKETIFMYTDGVNEAENSKEEFFGMSRLKALLKREDQEQCVNTIFEAIQEFSQDAIQSDDITMMAFSVYSESESGNPF
ncbi:MAG: PP2C family protein-serine/threonine phosphatase, partial [Allobaculum sp.]|nr:PP2C family protein-serine/threonine phosphatase [Allobaculum sp.]